MKTFKIGDKVKKTLISSYPKSHYLYHKPITYHCEITALGNRNAFLIHGTSRDKEVLFYLVKGHSPDNRRLTTSGWATPDELELLE